MRSLPFFVKNSAVARYGHCKPNGHELDLWRMQRLERINSLTSRHLLNTTGLGGARSRVIVSRLGAHRIDSQRVKGRTERMVLN